MIQTTDFVGKYAIAQNRYTEAELEAYLTTQNVMVKKILGNDLGTLFLADLSGGVPQTPIYINIFNPFTYVYRDCFVECVGLKEILVQYFYHLYTSEQPIVNQISGNGKLEQEATTFDMMKPYVIYNRMVAEIEYLRVYLEQNMATYSTFKRQFEFNYVSAI
ncbi:MAG TPA: hypothetical protein VFV37_11065 [Luteibaculaceae bacterium]|nr:hypothetical protein [Luteibaculaceae bacterium]